MTFPLLVHAHSTDDDFAGNRRHALGTIIVILSLVWAVSPGQAVALDCVNPQTKVVHHAGGDSCQFGERQVMPNDSPSKLPAIPATGNNAYPMRHVELENIARVLAYTGGRAGGSSDPRVFPSAPGSDDIFDRTTAKADALSGGDPLAPMTQKGDPAFRKLLAASGPNGGYSLVDSIDDKGKTGMQAMVLRDGTGQTFIAFRGTEPTDDRSGVFSLGPDLIADLNHQGNVGVTQYDAFRDKLSQWADLYPGSYVTGHSLGAALAEHYISDHPQAVKEAALFNVPGVSDEIAGRPGPWPPITLYMGRLDPISDLGGLNQVPGRVVEVTRPGSGAVYTFGDHSFTMLTPENRFDPLDYYDYEARRVSDYEHVRSKLQEAFGFLAGSIIADYAPRCPKLPTREMVDAANAQSREGRKILEYEIADRLHAMQSIIPAAQPAATLPPLAHPPVRTGSAGGTPTTAAPTALSAAQAGCAATTKGSSAQPNQSGKFDCVCPDGQGPNDDRSSCIPVNGGGGATVPAIDQQKAICQGLIRGSQPHRVAEGKYDCACPDGQETNPDNTACVAVKVVAAPPPPSCAGLHGSHLTYGPDGSPSCNCPAGQLISADGSACLSKKDATFAAGLADCHQQFPGSQPVWEDARQFWSCACPSGQAWTEDSTRCIDQAQAAQAWCSHHLPSSLPRFKDESGAYECDCANGTVYDGSSCVTAAADTPPTEGNEDGFANGFLTALTGALAQGQNTPAAPQTAPNNGNLVDLPRRALPPPVTAGPSPAEVSACSQAVNYMGSRGCGFAEVASDMGSNGANCGPTALFIRPHSPQTRFVPKGPNCIWHDCYDIDQTCAAMIGDCRSANHFPCR